MTYAHRPITVLASVEEVRLVYADEIIACHRRCWGKEQFFFDPLHYLALLERKRVRFYRVTEPITQLLEAREERDPLRLKKQLSKLDLLILDELGYVPASKTVAELLFDVISTAYERHSVIVTTNLPFENWTELLGSERLTGAALDRLTHRCHPKNATLLEASGESYRLQDAKRRRRRKPSSEAG